MLGDADRAMRCYEAALRIKPDHPYSRFNRGLALLQTGNFKDGWVEYEWRWRTGEVSSPDLPRPRWDGSSPVGRSILVHTEQGMGDTIQFIRLLPLLKQRGARVVFACQKPLHQLLATIDGVDEWFPIDEPADINFDCCVPLMSLPSLLGIDSEAAIPNTVPYVSAEPQRVDRWRERIALLPGLKVGLNWQGRPDQRIAPLRLIPLEKFAPLAQLENVTLVSLQKGEGEQQIEPNRDRMPLTVLDGLDADAAFVDTAAVMQHLDLIITSDTSVAHLAGAMGRPVWVLLSKASEWRFMLDRSDSPWYPTMRLFRQSSFGEWDPVIDQIVEELEQFGHQASAPPMILVSVGELIDKITILQIKQQRIADDAQFENINCELDLLSEVQQSIPGIADVAELAAELKSINERLWDVEDQIRERDAAGDFGESFVKLARAVYETNDRRSEVKRQINERVGSALVEVKAYASTKPARNEST